MRRILLPKHIEPKNNNARGSASFIKHGVNREQKKKLVNKRVKRESKLNPLFDLQRKGHSEVVKGSEAQGLEELRVWFPNINEEESMRLKALNANGKPAKTSVYKSFDPNKSMTNMEEEKLRGSARYSSVPGGVAASMQQKLAPVEGCKNPAVTVFWRPVRSQVESQREIDTTLGLEEEARCTHPESFDLPSRIQTDFAHPTPFQGQITGLMSCEC